MLSSTAKRRHLSAICYVGGFGVLFLLYGTLSLVGNDIKSVETKHDAEYVETGLGVSADFSVQHHSSRHLLFKLFNCTPSSIEQFPPTVFTQAQRHNGAVALYMVCAIYMFIGLSISCDSYFVPSLASISTSLKLRPDVAGATFMAAGSSAPELATALIGVFVAKDDIGLSAVVGSAVFNILFVISVCALFAGMVVQLSWWSLTRDCACYLISIIALACVIMDEVIYWYEPVILLILYALYIVLMHYNLQLEKVAYKVFTCCPRHEPGSVILEDESRDKATSNGIKLSVTTDINSEDDEESGLDEDRHSLLPPNGSYTQHLQRTPPDCRPVKKEEDNYEDRRLRLPDGYGWRLLWTLSLPLIIVQYFTVPDSRNYKWRKWYLVTFLMSCIWISIFSYVMVWMITVIGFTFKIPDTVMALTFIAAGVSVPDAIASLIVIKDGEGDMAVSNALGSNVFDILLCLGLPWFLKTCVITPGATISIYSEGLLYATLTLFITVVLLIGATWLNGWKLTKKYGVLLMISYVLVTGLTTLYELNVFGYVHPAACESTY